MKTKDPLDQSRDAAVDSMIDNAKSKAHVAMFGKAAWDAFAAKCERTAQWSELNEETQCAWVAAAQAVLDEARKAGWL